jgi:hypothetical protein
MAGSNSVCVSTKKCQDYFNVLKNLYFIFTVNFQIGHKKIVKNLLIYK